MRRLTHDKTWQAVPDSPAGAASLSVDNAGQAWVTDIKGDIYSQIGSAWVRRVGSATRVVTGGSDLTVWAVDSYGEATSIKPTQERVYMKNISA